MARVNEVAYSNMIDQLQLTSTNITNAVDQLVSLVTVVTNALGEEDSAIEPIQLKIINSKGLFDEAAAEALRIANEMLEEYDRSRREDDVWSGE